MTSTIGLPGFCSLLIVSWLQKRYDSTLMIFSKKNAGKWVASDKSGKVLVTDPKLSTVMKKVKGRNQDDIRLDLVPRTPFLAGGAL